MDKVWDLLKSITAQSELIRAQLRDLKTQDIVWMTTELTRANEALEDAVYILSDSES